ncbi:hypothetical protein M0R04_07690 [Candidatus Dojkabacteria bacterium]|jgi:predicted metal-dependent peptidase|nr:hypothetical protein [Candidatus Dojkabacteria bacterium]
MRISEAISNVKQQVTFASSDWNSPFIVHILQVLQGVGIPADAIKLAVADDLADLEQSHSIAPKLFKTMYQNRVENALFTFMWQQVDPTLLAQKIGAPRFSRPMMQRLLAEMAGANSGEFFPLRSVTEKQTLKHPLLEYSDDDPSYANITTAAASPNGNFIFDPKFMQALINYAYLKQVKPTSAFFKSNGGPIPDEYAYAEFVLAHELLHYTHSDFSRQHLLHNPSHKIINWASDLRSNYILVKSGYSQLPIGLYSSEFNYDKYRDFNKLYEDVKAELDKLPKNEQQQVGDSMDGQSSDSHEKGQEEGASQSEKAKAGAAGKDQMDKHDQKQNEAVEKGKEQANKPGKADAKLDPNAKSTGQPGTGEGYDQIIDTSKERPRISWKQIIAKFVVSAKQISQKSYSKISRRSAGTAAAVSSYGAGAITAGQVKFDDVQVNLVIVLDLSGSMGGVAARVLVEVSNLIAKHFPRSDFFIIAFSNTSQMFRCNLAKNTAMEIKDISETKGSVTPLKQLLTTYKGGGTVFSAVKAPLLGLLNKQYNVLLITDSDLIGGDNLSVFVEMLMKYRSLFNVILASANDFQTVSKALPVLPNNITHLT